MPSRPDNRQDVSTLATGGQESISRSIEALAGYDWVARRKARLQLTAIGEAVVEPLRAVISDPRDQVRWEAVKTLADIGSPLAAPLLVAALTDKENLGVRRTAAEGLVKLGREGLPPLLEALVENPRLIFLRRGAHQVVGELAKSGLSELVDPVLASLNGLSPAASVPFAAHAVLEKLRDIRRDAAA